MGSQAQAFVNPEDPSEAILELGHSTFLAVALFIAGLLWAAFWSSSFWLPLVQRSRGKPT